MHRSAIHGDQSSERKRNTATGLTPVRIQRFYPYGFANDSNSWERFNTAITLPMAN
jgi:hypothetical protein